jgi:hypothetical protein
MRATVVGSLLNLDAGSLKQAMDLNENYSKLFPTCTAFNLGNTGRNGVSAKYTEMVVEYDGRPAIPLGLRDSERVESYWELSEARLRASDGLKSTEVATGKLELLVTSETLRASFGSGTVPGLGTLHGGAGVLKPKLVFGFVWPLEAIDAVIENVAHDRLREIMIGSTTRGGGLTTSVAHLAKDAHFTLKGFGLGLRNRLQEFSDSVINAAAKRQLQIPERAQRAEAALKGERDTNREGFVVAWLGEPDW